MTLSTLIACTRAAIVTAVITTSSLQAQQSAVPAPTGMPVGYAPLTASATPSAAQGRRITLFANQMPLARILAEIARLGAVAFAMDASQPGMAQLRSVQLRNSTLPDALMQALSGTPFQALVSGSGELVIVQRPSVPHDDAGAAQPGSRARLSGYVRSRASGEVVRRAQIVAGAADLRIESNEEGFYSVLLPIGQNRVRLRAIGFAPFDTVIQMGARVERDFLLTPRNATLAAVRVEADGRDNRPDLDPRNPDMSVVRLDMAAIKLLPTVLGEPDPIRSLTLLPGVSLSSDASTAFSVRGGAADQNLYLLDEATVYNPSHVLGFLSTFNADAVDNVTLYKGAIPSRFGGRLSSVVDVRQREGNANEFAASASIGLLASRGTLEGPLPRRLGSYVIAARRSYADLFTRFANDSSVRESEAYFYDVNAKTNLRLGASGALMLSGYLGRDRFGDGRDFGAGWGNRAATLRWNQAAGGRLFTKVTAAFGTYDYRLDIVADTRDSIQWNSRIRSLDLKVDEALYLSPTNTIEFGAQFTSQQIRPGNLTPRGADNAYEARNIEARNTLLPALYVGQELSIGRRISVRYGLRYAGYIRRGQATVYRYANDAPVIYDGALSRYEPATPIDSTRYARGSRVASAGGVEPRLSARFLIDGASSVKASYARTQQFLLLASNTNSISPLDVWEPAGRHVRPQRGDQFALGYSANRGAWELSVEGYYKQAKDIVDFIDGADILLNPRVETQLVQGNGRAYGLELLARRTSGTTTGWISYTLGRAEQRFPVPRGAGTTQGGGINEGRWYPSPFDKTHNLSLVALRPLGRKWTIGSTFSFATGLPTTFPGSRYQIDGLLVTEFGTRNGGRLPLYHRLDVNATRRFRRGELQLG
ncbi:MAG TPA: TonB-dependent receptor, partial [Gemmatimonadaceae bacterium]|nr:TonB-dependent receptor [Gemmatimonadaceae bacterium]